MNTTYIPWVRRVFLFTAAALLLTTILISFPRLIASAEEVNSEEASGIQAFWDFFGPDGVNECLQTDPDQITCIPDDAPSTFSGEQAVLTTAWETVGGGRINRKYLNGLVAFCYDEELAFPSGATYQYAPASDAAVSGQVAAIAQRFGKSGVDNAQWWSECQVAIWAVRAGCSSYDSAAAFARSYCADRGITDPATVEDYAYIVGTLVTETAGASGTAYLYQAADPANQRILTCLAVWPDPAPTYPSPEYDRVSAEEEFTSSRTHGITIDRKSASITEESLAGAVFEVYENERLVGTITTDAQGKGSCQWTLSASSTASVTKEYCSNYDKLDPETRKTITGYTNREDARAAAQSDALAAARAQAEALADTPTTVTVREITVPTGFSPTSDSDQTISLAGEDSAALAAVNTPWSATLLIHKADGTTSETIPADAVFTLYEWNGTDYEVSPHYQIIRREDGVYTAMSHYPDAEPGQLYYTQQNQGRFALAETTAPEGYLLDPEWFYFEITTDGQPILAHNAAPDRYPICDDTKFANQAVTGTIQITKTGDYLTDAVLPMFQYTSLPVSGASFAVYNAEEVLVATITTDANGIACLEDLPLGTYTIREVTAGNGDLLLDPKVTTVTLSYQDQFTAVVLDDSIHYHNQRQKVSLELTKKNRPLEDVLPHILSDSFQDDVPGTSSASPLHDLSAASVILETLSPETLSSQLPLPDAVYGLYAAEDIYGYIWEEATGSVIHTEEPLIPAHTLLEQVTTDIDGQTIFTSDLPCGKYYIRELAAPAGYLPDTDLHPVDASYSGQEGDPTLHLTYSFDNDPICLIVTKIDCHRKSPLAGAQLELHRLSAIHEIGKEEWTLIAQWTSQEAPKLLWALSPGNYRLVEVQAPKGYQLADPVDFTIQENTPLTTIQMVNEPIPPQIPQEPKLPSTSGAPTGDDSPITLSCWCLLGSLFLLVRSSLIFLPQKERKSSLCDTPSFGKADSL